MANYEHTVLPDGLCLLAYGRAGELAAIRQTRRRAGELAAIRQTRRSTREPRAVDRAEVRRFEAYARMLAAKYAYHGSGADEDDVEQEAVVAAWKALEDHRPGPGSMSVEAFVKERMRWRVVDFVRIRGGQRALDRRVAQLQED